MGNPGGLKAAIVEPVGGHGGMDYYDSGLCEGLSGAGVEATLYTSDETARRDGARYGVSFPYRGIYGDDPAWRRGLRYLRGSVRALSSARLGGVRVAHLHFFHVGPPELFNVLLAKLFGLKVVVTAHDVQSFVEGLSVPWMVRMTYRLADRVVAQSGIAHRELRTLLKEPEAKKIDLIPHGNYLRSVGEVPSRTAARARVGVPENSPVLLFFGHIKEVKGLDVLLRAMPRLLRERPGAVLLIAGKVWKDDFFRYRRLMDELGIRKSCVSHIRYIPESEMADYYAAADVVVLPYRRIYQSGVLLMAMSYGRPVVVSDIEGMTEIVSDGENGYVFPDGDSEALAATLSAALSSRDDLRSLGERSRAYVEAHHDWDEIGYMTAQCYRAALGGEPL